MLFKKTKVIEDHELGLLEARISIFKSSLVKWKKSICFLGNNVLVEVKGTISYLNKEERIILIEAFKKKELLEKQVLEVIRGFCVKNNVKEDDWGDYFKCSRIYCNNLNLYVSITDKLNQLIYEIEINYFGKV